MSKRKIISGLCVPFAMLAATMTWPVWLLLAIGWGIARCFRPEGVKVTERNRAKAAANLRAQRIDTAIQMELTAHRLLDTPENRARVGSTINRRP